MTVKTVGRGPDNNIVINDENVSRKHLQMLQDDNGNVSVVDLGSTNGTYVNGMRITSETRLKPGDTVRIGNTALPWQTYFRKAQTSIPPKPTKKNMKWWFIGGGIVLLLLIVGGVLIIVNNNKEAEKERVEQELRNKQVIEGMDEDYIKIMNKKRKAELDAKAEKEKRAEEEKRHTVESQHVINNKIVADNKANVAQVERDNEHNALIKACLENDTMKQKVKEANEKAEEKAKIAQEATAKANEQTEKAKLTEEFYKELREAAQSKKRLKEVCTALDIQDAKNNDDRYNKIEAKFNSAKDNAARRSIINTIKNTKKKKQSGKNSETQEEGEPK